MTQDTVVIDLDGTLANVDHRRHLVTGKKRDYEAFHALLHLDPVNEWCRYMMRALIDTGLYITIVSARPRYCEEATLAWLWDKKVPFDQVLLLRPEGDSTPDQDLKRSWLRAYGKDRVLFVVDDRQKVVDMWRAEGVVCLQCAAWKEGQVQ